MILPPDQLALIRSRRKTRITLPAGQPCRLTAGRVYRARTVNAGWTAAELKDWRDYCQQEQPSRARAIVAYLEQPIIDAHNEPAPVQVTVLEVQQQTLGDITQQDAQREGFRFLQHFRNWWENEYGSWDDDTPVWVVTFCVGDLSGQFDRPRLLKATPGHYGESVEEHQDYTERPYLAMWGEPEAIDGLVLRAYSDQAREQDRLRKMAELEARKKLPLHERIRLLKQDERNGHAPVRDDLRVIEQRLRKAA